MTELQSEIQAKARRLKWKGKRNYLFAYCLYAAAAVASGAATIWTAALASNKSAPNTWVVIIASVPALAIVLSETLRPELKGRWCYEKRGALEALLRKSKYAGEADQEIVERWNELELKMEREWPRFGSFGARRPGQRK
jgi:hypothetical protein